MNEDMSEQIGVHLYTCRQCQPPRQFVTRPDLSGLVLMVEHLSAEHGIDAYAESPEIRALVEQYRGQS
jgi:hypothetical protein